jgi:hypothetical protein
MLYDLQMTAAKHGIHAERFWKMSYQDILVQLEANTEARKRELQEQSVMDYIQSQLNAYAMNEPNKMPKYEKMYAFFKTEEEKELDEEMAFANQFIGLQGVNISEREN